MYSLHDILLLTNTGSKLAQRTREQNRRCSWSFIVDFGLVFAHMVLKN